MQVKRDKQAVQIRYRSGGKGEAKQYDLKQLFTGKSRGWTVFDLMTANAVMAVYNGANEEMRPKLDTIPLNSLISFCWRMVA